MIQTYLKSCQTSREQLAFQKLFKNENNIDAPINVCSETPLSITNVELQHELTNLGNRFNRIKETWTAQEVKDDVNAQTIN